MAKMNSSGSAIQALSELGEQVLEASVWASTAIDLAGDDVTAPQWPWLAQRQLARIEDALEVVQLQVRELLKGAAK